MVWGKQKLKSRMFHIVSKTYNPYTGCLHDCIYCYARKLVERRLCKIHKKYKNGFVPTFHEYELKKTFRNGDIIFVCDMGDLFGNWVKREWIERIINHVSKFPNTTFIFLTKNPIRYLEFEFPNNCILGTTIETDDDVLYSKYKISKAPIPSERIKAMKQLEFPRKFISIEPVLKFSRNFPDKIAEIEGIEFIYVGYDNWKCKLPEPKLSETLWLIDSLKDYGFTVYEKTIRKAWYE